MNYFRSLLLTPLLVCLAALSFAQTGLLKGRLLNAGNGSPAAEVQVTIPALKMLTTTSGTGEYSLSPVPYGSYMVVVGGVTAVRDSFRVTINSPVADMGDRNVVFNETSALAQQLEQIPTIGLEDNQLSVDNEEGIGGQNVSGLLTGSRDPFLSTVAYVFGNYRFQPRGYDRNQQEVLINGVPMNDIETGDAYWSQWGGLNDVFRGRTQTYGLQPSEYGFGGINGTVFFDAAAANQRKQARATYSLSNRGYRNRAMLTYSSGLLKNGWAYSLSASKRWAEEGYVPGTFYDGYSYYAAASKKFGNKHMLNLTVFGAPTRRGKMSPVTQEVFDLAGTNYYNPNWGYQNGVKRNARVADVHQPVGILSYEYTPNDKTRWQTSVSYQFGKNKNSALDWYNGDNPRADYYRYLPSYYELNEEDPSNARFLYQQQIDWDGLIQTNYGNYETQYDVNGIAGNNVFGRRSVYVVSSYVDDIKKGVISSSLQQVLSDRVTLHAGVRFVDQRTESYRQLDDLLGGDYYVNLNQFAVQTQQIGQDINQFDLNQPNRLIKEGDRYAYDYIQHFQKAWSYLQFIATFNKVDLFISGTGGFNTFNREGLYRSGLFPNNSYGPSYRQTFAIYGAKGGATYKINGRNYLFVNAGMAADAPTFDNTFISPSTRNTTVDNPTTQTTRSVEGGYLLRAPRFNARVVGYATEIDNATEIKRFYNDDPAFRTFVNYVLQDMKLQFTGAELALSAMVTPQLSVTGVGALGQAFYANNPRVSVVRDNDTTTSITSRKVYIKNYSLATGPQTAASLGFRYSSRQYWNVGLTGSFYDNNYVDINPDRRTIEASDKLTPGTDLYEEVLGQKKLPSAFTVDFNAGASLLLNRWFRQLDRRTLLYIYLNVSNLLDNKEIITGGFEQLRYDFTDSQVGKFPPKYFYGYGRNFSLNISLQF